MMLISCEGLVDLFGDSEADDFLLSPFSRQIMRYVSLFHSNVHARDMRTFHSIPGHLTCKLGATKLHQIRITKQAVLGVQ